MASSRQTTNNSSGDGTKRGTMPESGWPFKMLFAAPETIFFTFSAGRSWASRKLQFKGLTGDALKRRPRDKLPNRPQ